MMDVNPRVGRNTDLKCSRTFVEKQAANKEWMLSLLARPAVASEVFQL